MSHEDRCIKLRLAWFAYAQKINVSRACRHFGISRRIYYKWLHRYEAHGVEGLKDRSRRPHRSPRGTPREARELILHLRRTYRFGPSRIHMYLKRYHGVTCTTATIYHILKVEGENRLLRGERIRGARLFKRYEQAVPGRHVQIDVKVPGGKRDGRPKRYQFTALDDTTRLRVLRIYERTTQVNAIAFLDHVLTQMPFQVQIVRTDNGSEFQSGFHWHCLDKGLQHRYIKPRSPRLNGKVERSHKTDDEEFYGGLTYASTEELNTKLQRWQDYYNYQRPHWALGSQTPYERLQTVLQKQLAA